MGTPSLLKSSVQPASLVAPSAGSKSSSFSLAKSRAVTFSYSIEQLLALEEYSRTKSRRHILWVLVWTPLPPLFVIFLYQLPPLAPPEAGLRANWMYVLERGGLGWGILFERCMAMTYDLIPEFAAALHLRTRLGLAITAGITQIITIVGFAYVWGFPVPFTASIAIPIGAGVVCLALFLVVRRIVKEKSYLLPQIIACFVYGGVFSSASLVYPAYIALFVAIGELHPQYQPLVTLLGPVIKLVLRKAMMFACHEWPEIASVILVFSIELFGSLYQAMAVQSSSSQLTTAVIVTLDLATTIRSQWNLYQRTKSLQELLCTTASNDVLLVRARICEDPSPLQASSSSDLQRLKSISLYSSVTYTRVSAEVRQRLEKIDESKRFQSAKHPSLVTPTRSMNQQPVPSPQSLFTKVFYSRNTVAPKAQEQRGSAANAPKTDKRTLMESKQCAVLVEATDMLVRTEWLLLTEYLECSVPFFYAISVVLIWFSRNAPYYPQTQDIPTSDALLRALLNVVVLLVAEVATFVLLIIVLWRRLRISPLHQVGFVLERHAKLIRGNMFVAFILVLSFNVAHAGTDFTFQFKWLQ